MIEKLRIRSMVLGLAALAAARIIAVSRRGGASRG